MTPGPPPAVLDRLSTFGIVTDVGSVAGGFSHVTLRARVDGAAVVVKAAADPVKRADLRHEQAVLELLDGHGGRFGLAVPRLIGASDDRIEVDGWTISLLEHLPGQPGLDLLAGGEIERIVASATLLGRTARALRTIEFDGPFVEGLGRSADRDAALLTVLQSRFADRDPIGQLLCNSLELLNSPESAADGEIGLVHGDFGFHNTLWTASRLSGLVDWEASGAGGPIVDPAWAWWSFGHRSLPDEVWSAFVDGYGRDGLRQGGWGPGVVRLAVHAQMAHWLSRTEQDSAPDAEWRRRVRVFDDRAVPPA